jgi:hypothetical protein
MQTRQGYVIERQLRREGGHCADAMARGAGALAMAAGAEIAFAAGTHTMLADPVAVVNEVARGRRVLCAEVDVTGIACAQAPLLLVLVTAQADGHLRQQRLGPHLGDGAMAADAVAVDDGIVLGMVEAHVLARKLGPLPHRRFSVAPEA